MKKDDLELNDKKNIKPENDYIPIMEHKKIIKEMERNLSEIVTENFQLKDMVIKKINYKIFNY